MYILVAIVVVFVIVQSIVFLRIALKRAREMNIDSAKIKRVIASSAVFTIAPAIAILIGVIALSASLGFPFPWLRLSVIGALTYEAVAAESAAKAVGLAIGGNLITDAKAFATIAWVMTLGIVTGLLWMPLFGKKVERGLGKLKERNAKLGDLLLTSLFMGMIAAFSGVVFARTGEGLVGWIPVFVMIAAAILMLICGLLLKVTKAKWINDYALPLSMLGGMALAIPITNIVMAAV